MFPPAGPLLMTIQEVLEGLGVAYAATGHHHCREGWIQLKCCPFCGSQNYHLGWNLRSNYASCWRCGGYNGKRVLEALGVPVQEVLRLFRSINIAPQPEKPCLGPRRLKEPIRRGPLLSVHREYLRKRGFSPEHVCRLWDVEGIGLAPRLSWRLYIPICFHEQRVSWTTRAIGSKVAQRYVSASAAEEAVNHKTLVYGMDFCRHSIVICEGPLDAWKIGPGGGALFGTAFTTAQIRKLVAIPRRFVCFDSSPDAQRRARELCHQLACFPGVTENLLIDAKDPGEASEKELRLIRKIAALR